MRPQQYSETIKRLGRSWKDLNPEEKHQYNMQAMFENQDRQELLATPLPTASGKHRTERQLKAEADPAFRKFLIRSKAKRSRYNDLQFRASSSWGQNSLGLADAQSALRPEFLDTGACQSHAAEMLQKHVHSHLPHPNLAAAGTEATCHDVTCGCIYGQCIRTLSSKVTKLCHTSLAAYFLKQNVSNGTLLRLQLQDTVHMKQSQPVFCFLSVAYKRPALHIYVLLHPTHRAGVFSLLGNHTMPTFWTSYKLFTELNTKLEHEPDVLEIALYKSPPFFLANRLEIRIIIIPFFCLIIIPDRA